MEDPLKILQAWKLHASNFNVSVLYMLLMLFLQQRFNPFITGGLFY